MKKNKIEAVDKTSYYNAFNKWLNASTEFFDTNNKSYMNEKWLSFVNDLGVSFKPHATNDQLFIEVEDSICWKEAKKYYSIISYAAVLEE